MIAAALNIGFAVNLFHVRAGKVTRIVLYFDRERAFADLGLPSEADSAHAERWVRTVRSECLDWLLILGRRQLERVLRTLWGA